MERPKGPGTVAGGVSGQTPGEGGQGLGVALEKEPRQAKQACWEELSGQQDLREMCQELEAEHIR